MAPRSYQRYQLQVTNTGKHHAIHNTELSISRAFSETEKQNNR
jgi:hypothetical protein